jgi:uncharacterized protein YhbP (UPF0306 family)
MEIKPLLQKYLPTRSTMQLATVSSGQPWLCTVHYVHDDTLNFYWLSLPTRRHSQELAADPRAAIAVAIKVDQPVIGMQAEGTTQSVNDTDEIKHVMRLYSSKHGGSGSQFYENFLAGTNEHMLYKFIPKNIVLFDEVDFPGNGRKEWRLDKA